MTDEERIKKLALIVEDLAEMVSHFAQLDNEGRGENKAPEDVALLKRWKEEARTIAYNH